MDKKARFLIVAFVLASGFFSLPLFAAPSGDPNAALRKLTSAGKDPTLVEFEKVKRLNNDSTIAHFTAALQKNPKDSEAYVKRGKAYSGNRLYDKALDDFNKAILLNPKAVDAYMGRAVIYLMKKDYDKCWTDVHQTEALGGQFWPAFMDALKKSSGRDK